MRTITRCVGILLALAALAHPASAADNRGGDAWKDAGDKAMTLAVTGMT